MKYFRYPIAVLIIAFLTLFLILPVYTVVAEGLNPALIREVFSNFIYLEGLLNSFKIAVVTTFFVFLIALPMAFVYDSYDFPGKNLSLLAAMVPMILPPFVGALGFQQILGHYGVLNTILVECGFSRVDFLTGNGRFWSICFIEALHLYPILYLNLVSSLGNIDPALQDAAKNMGAGWFRRFFRITLPLLKPGILAGGSIVLIWSFTDGAGNESGTVCACDGDAGDICSDVPAGKIAVPFGGVDRIERDGGKRLGETARDRFSSADPVLSADYAGGGAAAHCADFDGIFSEMVWNGSAGSLESAEL